MTMPSLMPNFICRGARFATQTTSRPTSVAGLYASLMPANTVFVVPPPRLSVSFKQLLRVRHVLGRDHAGHAQVDLREVVDRAFGRERLGGEGVAGVVPRMVLSCRRRSSLAGRWLLLSSIMAMHVLFFDALKHVLEFVDRRADERRLRLLPTSNRIVQQLARLLGQPRQHGRQVNGDLPEQVERHGAHILQLARLGRRPCAAPTACVLRRTDWPGPPGP